MTIKYLYYIDGVVEDAHGDAYAHDVSVERAREIAREYNAVLLDEDGATM